MTKTSSKYALIIVDMLNDFVYGKLKCQNALKIIEPTKTLIDFAHKNNIPVFFANDYHTNKDHELTLWGPHAMAETDGAQVINELKPIKTDYIINKHVYSAFFGTNLNKQLKKMKVNSLIITGLHTHMCCRHTAADGFQHGYHIIIPKDATTSFTQQDYESGLEYLKGVYNVKITTTTDLIKEIK
jgi:nicotinamidase-related amidase